MKTAYKYITIQILPQTLGNIIQEGNETDKKIRAELDLANAAPELLEALEAISQWTESAKCKREIGGLQHSKLLASCKSAIAKARGE